MNKTRIITRTAVVLALALLFQNLRYLIGGMPNSNLIIGTLVNLCLIIAAGAIGLIPASVIAVITPVIALLQRQIPHPFLVPVTALGNFIFALVFYLFLRSRLTSPINSAAGVLFGALLKWGVMYFVGVRVVLFAIAPAIPEKAAAAISVSFHVPQLFTALAGGILAILIMKVLKLDHA